LGSAKKTQKKATNEDSCEVFFWGSAQKQKKGDERMPLSFSVHRVGAPAAAETKTPRPGSFAALGAFFLLAVGADDSDDPSRGGGSDDFAKYTSPSDRRFSLGSGSEMSS